MIPKIFSFECFAKSCHCNLFGIDHCDVCQTLTNVAQVRVKMVAHASTASTATCAAVQLATPARAVKRVRHLFITYILIQV